MTNPARARGRSPRSRRSARTVLRAALAMFGALSILSIFLPALPAAAAYSGTGPGIGGIGDVGSPDGLSLPLTILLYGGIPLVGFIIGGLLAFRPSKGDARRYRPGRAWTYEPVWFGDESGLELEPKRAALPGAGGARGSW